MRSLPVTAIILAALVGSANGAVNPAPAPDNDAAARHARRTACLKEAKARKLVGSQKDTFIKECLAGT